MDERLIAQLEVAALTDDDFVDRAYSLILRRPADEDARALALESLRTHSLSRAALVADLVASAEFVRVQALDDAVARASAAREADERPHDLTAPAGVDERPVEIAWTLGRYRGEPRVLDIGYAYAEPAWLAALLDLGARELVAVDRVERSVPRLQRVVADVRDLPFADRAFDVVFCISTLEHVGRDNTVYGGEQEDDPAAPLAALRELRRITRRRGRILLTVPCGPTSDDWYLREPAEAWRERFREADLYVYDEETYVGGPDGWRSGNGERDGVLCVELHPGRVRHEIVRRLRRRRR